MPLRNLPRDLALAVFESTPIGIVIISSAAANQEPVILFTNQAFCTMTGYVPEAVLGLSPSFLVGPETSPEVVERLRDSFSTRAPFDGETWAYRADGSAFLMQWSMTAVHSEESGEDYFFALKRDVTELRQLEALAGAANLADNVGYIFATIRHELGNPINSIKAALTLLRRSFVHYPPERIASTLERILEELRRVEYILADLRSYNAYEQVSGEAIDIAEFFDKFYKLTEESCRERDCELHFETEPTAPRQAFFDRRALHQVLLNLITNALDAFSVPEGSSPLTPIPLDTEKRRIEFRISSNRRGAWTIEVSDNGPGIPAEMLARVFMPFFTTKTIGTGLGLSIVQKLLVRMKGTVSVRSTVGKGTTFAVELPDLLAQYE